MNKPMDKKLTPEDLQNEQAFELLTEVSHRHLREFVMELITQEKKIIRIYSIYQIVMMILFAFLLTRGIVFSIKGNHDLLLYMVMAIVFSVTALIVIHELLHALAYLAIGARKISFGTVLKKFILYAIADRQVINSRAFKLVALTPFVIVKLVCFWGIIQYYNHPLVYFFLAVMCLHSLFCAGDIAMLAFYKLHEGKEIYNFDDKSEGKTYFYARK
jgi:hypothetical protein